MKVTDTQTACVFYGKLNSEHIGFYFISTDPKMKKKASTQRAVHVSSRQSPYPSNDVQRFPVFDKYVPWKVSTAFLSHPRLIWVLIMDSCCYCCVFFSSLLLLCFVTYITGRIEFPFFSAMF